MSDFDRAWTRALGILRQQRSAYASEVEHYQRAQREVDSLGQQVAQQQAASYYQNRALAMLAGAQSQSNKPKCRLEECTNPVTFEVDNEGYCKRHLENLRSWTRRSA